MNKTLLLINSAHPHSEMEIPGSLLAPPEYTTNLPHVNKKKESRIQQNSSVTLTTRS